MCFQYKGKLKQQEIEQKAKELAEKIKYEFKNINYLCAALYCQKISGGKYTNSAIALIGDNVLKLALSHKFYLKKADKEYINDEKKKFEMNEKLKKVCDKLGIYRFAFNDEAFYSEDLPEHQKLSHPTHDSYVEAVIGAIYFDRGFPYARKWIYKCLLPCYD